MEMSEGWKSDCGVLSKFVLDETYIESLDELYESITDEIRNILSSRLGLAKDLRNKHGAWPFSYGVPDLQSASLAEHGIEELKECYKSAILAFEPRVDSVEITDIEQAGECLLMSIAISIKGASCVFQVGMRVR